MKYRATAANKQLKQGENTPPLMPDNFRISPEKRICPSYDYQAIAAYRVASRDTMGFRVIDDFVQEHIM